MDGFYKLLDGRIDLEGCVGDCLYKTNMEDGWKRGRIDPGEGDLSFDVDISNSSITRNDYEKQPRAKVCLVGFTDKVDVRLDYCEDEGSL